MKLLPIALPLLLFASIIYAAPGDTPTVTTETPAPVVNKDEAPVSNKPSLPVITNFDPKIDVASPVGKEDLCSTNRSPAQKQVVLAFRAFHTAKLYMLGAIINENPTHDELQEAAKWQLGQTEEIAKVAKDLNNRDRSAIRKGWYKSRLRWLRFKIKVARKLIERGLPCWPKLGKFVTWFKAKREKMRKRMDRWNKKLGNLFHRKKAKKDKGDKKDDKSEPSTTPPSTTTPTTTPPTTTPPTTSEPTTTEPNTIPPALLSEEDAKKLVLEVPKTEVVVSKEELKKEIEAIAPTSEAREAAANVAADNSPMAKNNPNFPSAALIQASGNVVSEEVLEKLGLSVQEENAKVEVILEEIDTTKLC